MEDNTLSNVDFLTLKFVPHIQMWNFLMSYRMGMQKHSTYFHKVQNEVGPSLHVMQFVREMKAYSLTSQLELPKHFALAMGKVHYSMVKLQNLEGVKWEASLRDRDNNTNKRYFSSKHLPIIRVQCLQQDHGKTLLHEAGKGRVFSTGVSRDLSIEFGRKVTRKQVAHEILHLKDRYLNFCWYKGLLGVTYDEKENKVIVTEAYYTDGCKVETPSKIVYRLISELMYLDLKFIFYHGRTAEADFGVVTSEFRGQIRNFLARRLTMADEELEKDNNISTIPAEAEGEVCDRTHNNPRVIEERGRGDWAQGKLMPATTGAMHPSRQRKEESQKAS
ncbi:hypothetical protein C2S53_004684 [Perilla frutescens var. hirtella]|uniref:Uncharacterized protein n=1 Tax=Perilla frutescens var. hirtella TaxID=608512 RepID=A0AAD4P4Z2_PERFH|nr:hypothetical protein C2S53_004684 [Perilla frutescens var. hirtella]